MYIGKAFYTFCITTVQESDPQRSIVRNDKLIRLLSLLKKKKLYKRNVKAFLKN